MMTELRIRWAWRLLFLALPLAFHCLAQADSTQEYTFSEEKEFSSEQITFLSVSNTKGDITIQGTDEDLVTINYIKRVKARSQEEAKDWAEKVAVIIDVDRDENELIIETKMPGEWSESLGSLIKGLFERKPSVRVDFEIHTPRKMAIEVASVSGDIIIASIDGNVAVDVVSGDLELEDVNGDVRIDNISGDMIVQTVRGDVEINAVSGNEEVSDVVGRVSIDVTSGDVSIKRITGELTVDATSGDVAIREVNGDVSIDVTSGDITLHQTGGDLWIDTSSGDVSVETIVERDGQYEVDTSSGEIVFRIPENSSAMVDLETSGGRIHAKLPMIVESVSRTQLRGTIGSGEAEIVLSTSGGDIDLLPLK